MEAGAGSGWEVGGSGAGHAGGWASSQHDILGRTRKWKAELNALS